MRVVPKLAERLDHPDADHLRRHAEARRALSRRPRADRRPTSSTRSGAFSTPPSSRPRKGAYRELRVGRRTRSATPWSSRSTGPFASFPDQPGHADRAGRAPARRSREHPIGTGPYRFVRYAVDDRVELAPLRRTTSAAGRRTTALILQDRARRHHARPRAAERHDRPRRQRPDAGHRATSSRASDRAADGRVAGRGLSVHRAQPAGSRPARRTRAPGARLRHRPPGHRRRTCAAAWRAGRRHSCRPISWAFAADTCLASRTTRRARGRCSTRPATAIPTATARCRGCG